MTQALPPGISALAQQYKLGAPAKRCSQSGRVVLFGALIGIFILSDVVYLLSVLSHPATLDLGQVIFWQIVNVALIGASLYYIWDSYSSVYYLCSAGFLEVTRGRSPKVKHALRWDQVSSTRKPRRDSYYVTDKQGREFRVKNAEIWNRCQQMKGKRSKR